MIIAKDISGESYQKLIRYAIDNSDAVMAVISNKAGTVITVDEYYQRWKTFLPHLPVPDIAWENWKNDEKRRTQEIAIYNAEYHLYTKLLEPFIIKERYNTVWPCSCSETIGRPYTITVYRACEELYPLLLIPKSYLAWNYPRYPKDLCFFDSHRCWLAGCSHEEYIEFLPRSQEEYDYMASLGMELPEPYRPIDDSEYYWEEYTV